MMIPIPKLLKFLVCAILLPLVWLTSLSGKPPNIVFILSDDHRADFMGVAGNAFIETPRLDALAGEGLRFTNAFSVSATCSPSRAAFWTGRYPFTASAPYITHQNNSFLETQTLFPELLREAGYTTAMLGKWHMGHDTEKHRAFDYWAGWEHGRPFDEVFYVNGKRVESKGFADDVIAQMASDYIGEQSRSRQPFFLYVGLRSPHRPFAYPERLESVLEDADIPKPDSFDEDFRDSGRERRVLTGRLAIKDFSMYTRYFRTWERFIKSYYRSAQSIDESVGAILDALDRAGLADNTIVIYSSDHGYNLGDHGLVEKHFAYEETIRIPWIMRWPNRIPAGAESAGMVTNLDLAPTLLDAAGIEIPDTVQGLSLAPLIRDPANVPPEWREDYLFVFESRDGLIPGQVALRGERYKLVTYTDFPKLELYDLERDPQETKNVADDPEYAAVLKQMQTRFAEKKAEAGYLPRPQRKTLDSVYVARDLDVATAAAVSAIFDNRLFDPAAPEMPRGVAWERVEANGNGEFSPAQITGKSGSLSLLAIPMERKLDYDPHVAIWAAPWAYTRMFDGGKEIWHLDPSEKIAGNLANPPLDASENTVLLSVEAMKRPISIYVESSQDSIAMPGME